MRRLLSGLAIFVFSIILSACGFHLPGKQQIPKPLKTLSISSSDPYNALNKQIQQALVLRGVKIIPRARFILKISPKAPATSLNTINSAEVTRTYTVSLESHFEIIDSKTQKPIRQFTLNGNETITLFSSQLLNNSSEEEDMIRSIQRNITEQFFFALNAKATQTALATALKSQ